MCNYVQEGDVIIQTVQGLLDAGFTVTDDELDPSYRHQGLEKLRDCCLCGVQLESVLIVSEVFYRFDFFGYQLAPGTLQLLEENGDAGT